MPVDRDLIFRVSIADAPSAVKSLGTVMEAVRRMQREEIAGATAVAAARRQKLSETERLALKVAADQERAAQKSAAGAVRAEQQKARDVQRSLAQEARERSRVYNQASRDLDRALRQQVRDFEKAEKEKTSATKKAAREREDIERAVGRAQQASAARQLAMNAKLFQQQERATLQRARDEAFNRGRLYRGLGGSVIEGAYGGLRAVGAVAGFGLRQVGRVASSLGLQESYDVGDIFAQRLQKEQTLRYVQMESGGKVHEGRASAAIARASRTTGLSQREILRAVDKASEMGDPTRGVENIEQIAKEAKAYGADITDIMTLRQQAVISAAQSGTELSDADLSLMVAKMGKLGKIGTMRISDLAKRSPELFSRWAASGQSLTGGALDELIGFTEVARSASGGSAKTTTSVKQVQDAILKKEAKIDAMLGPHTVRDAKTGAEHDPIDIMMRVLAKAGPTGLSAIVSGKGAIFDTKAMSAINPFVAAMAGETTEAGRLKAMRAMLAKASDTAGISAKQTDVEFAGAMDTTASKIAVAKEKIRQSLEETLVPVFEKLAGKLPAAVATIQGAIQSVGPMLTKLGTSLSEIWQKLSPTLLPIAKSALGFAADHPVLATFGYGALKTGGRMAAVTAGRYLGESLVNKVPGIGGALAKTLVGGVGTALSQAGSQPVYITGAAPGVFGGGGGGGGMGIPGGAGGVSGALGVAPAVLGAVAVGALAMTAGMEYHYANQNKLGYGGDTGGKRIVSTAQYEEGMGFVRSERKRREEGMMEILDESLNGPKPKPQEQAANPLKFKVGADGTLETTTKDPSAAAASTKPNIDKFVGALDKATVKLEDLANKAGAAGDNASKIKNPPLPH